MGLLAEFGGLFSVVAGVFATMGFFINSRVHAADMLNEMYYLKLSEKKDVQQGMWKNLKVLTGNLYEFTFTKKDMFCEMKDLGYQMCCCRCGENDYKTHLDRTELLYFKGLCKIYADLDVINILKSIHKLKAGLNAIVGEDIELATKVQQYYQANTTIFSESEEERAFMKNNWFLNFMNQDDKHMLNEIRRMQAEKDAKEIADKKKKKKKGIVDDDEEKKAKEKEEMADLDELSPTMKALKGIDPTASNVFDLKKVDNRIADEKGHFADLKANADKLDGFYASADQKSKYRGGKKVPKADEIEATLQQQRQKIRQMMDHALANRSTQNQLREPVANLRADWASERQPDSRSSTNKKVHNGDVDASLEQLVG